MLSYLPLFTKNNYELKSIYVHVLKRVCSEIFDNHNNNKGSKDLIQSKQFINFDDYYNLLLIASIHPLFNNDEQSMYLRYATSIEQFINMNRNDSAYSSTTSISMPGYTFSNNYPVKQMLSDPNPHIYNNNQTDLIYKQNLRTNSSVKNQIEPFQSVPAYVTKKQQHETLRPIADGSLKNLIKYNNLKTN